jgi:hypothetical protein
MERNFGATAPYTVGVEEELQLVDPTSLALVPAIDAVLAASHTAKLPEDSIASELSASCVEVRSPVYGTVAELAAELPVLRRRLRDLVEGCGARLAAAGAHPFSKATAQQITGKERYRRVDKEMGWPARMQAIYGLHVHTSQSRTRSTRSGLSPRSPDTFPSSSRSRPTPRSGRQKIPASPRCARRSSASCRVRPCRPPSAPGRTSRASSTPW